MNTTATTGISDVGAAPVGHQLQRLPIGCQPTSTAPVVHYVPAEAGTNLYLYIGGPMLAKLVQNISLKVKLICSLAAIRVCRFEMGLVTNMNPRTTVV